MGLKFMKIYFAGSISGGRGDQEIYYKLINYLKNYGTVLTEHIADPNLSSYGEQDISLEDIYNRDIKWIEECDLFIAEVTQVSLGVGYELAYAEKLNKKIICLYRPDPSRKLSAMISGNKHFIIRNYKTTDEAIKQLEILLK